MLKNKKLTILALIFISFLCISSALGEYIFTKSDSENVDGNTIIAGRQFPDIILKAGYENTSCTVQSGIDGSEVSLDDVEKFFIQDKDVEDLYGNHFVQLKKYYINMSQDSEGIITYNLSSTKLDDTYFVCPYFKDKDGNEVDYAYYGKYKGSVTDGKLCSKSGVTPINCTSIDSIRSFAKENGEEYHQTDWCAVFTAQIMFMCAYKTTKSTGIIPDRGKLQTTGTATEQILGIEDLTGNGMEMVDGIVVRGGSSLDEVTISWADKISDYAADLATNQTVLTGATGSSGEYISKMYYGDDQPALSLFPKELGGSNSTFYCNSFDYGTTVDQTYVTFWGASGWYDYDGIFYYQSNRNWGYRNGTNVCARLHAKKIVSSKITLKAGYEDASCVVTDFNGDDISQDDVKKFFVQNEDVEDSYGNHFVQLKKYYINMTQDSSGVITYKLSNTKVDDTYFICPYFYDKDGNEIDYAYYGKYKASVSDSKLCSKSGVTPRNGTSIDSFRSFARANGEEYHQTDWCTVFTAQIMFMCAYKTTNSSSILTYRVKKQTTGTADSQFFGIEDIIGNGFEFVDGLAFKCGPSDAQLSQGHIYWANKISEYATCTDLTTNEANLDGYIDSTWGNDNVYVTEMICAGSSALSLFPKDTNGDSSHYYCDKFFNGASEGTYYSCIWGASGSSNAAYGMFCLNFSYTWGTNNMTNLGARLHAKKIELAS